jgi:glutamate dehydrogenase (NADP+)
VYYIEHMIKHANPEDSFKGKRVVISGSGNVAQYAALKVIELGGIVMSLSDSKGAIIATTDAGITPKQVEAIAAIKVARKSLSDIASTADFEKTVKYIDGARPWLHVEKIDVAIPSATQNEVSEEEAEGLIKAGCKFIGEGSNMGSTQEAIEVFETSRKEKGAESIWYAPGKAANLGGVAVSGLEMAQNSSRVKWTAEEVDNKLKDIMRNCFDIGLSTAEGYVPAKKGEFPSLVAGSNIAGFVKVAEAMKDQGDWW